MFDLEWIFERLDPEAAVLLAVSGGSDSMAVLHLFAAWAERQELTSSSLLCHVATVDHQLREGSRDDADFVAEHAARLGLPHTILTWTGDKPTTGVMALARDARYALLHELADDLWPDRPCEILLGHTRDDLAETFVMNLARGSDIEGLSGMPPRRILKPRTQHAQKADPPDRYLVRPLLDQTRSELRSYLSDLGVTWRDDPSNENITFERVRTRQAMATLEALGVRADAIARSARRVALARDAIRNEVWEAYNAISNHAAPDMTVHAPIADLMGLSEAVRRRLLSVWLFEQGGQELPPSVATIERLLGRLEAAIDARKDLCETAAGCLVFASHDCRSLNICREAGRAQPTSVTVVAGHSVDWDHRFRATLTDDALQPLLVMSEAIASEKFGATRNDRDDNRAPAGAATFRHHVSASRPAVVTATGARRDAVTEIELAWLGPIRARQLLFFD